MGATQTYMRAIQTGDVDSGVSQACLSNLVIYSEDTADEQMLNETVANYIVKHPCRVILIFAFPRAGQPRLDASYAAHTYSDGAGKSVNCDQITLSVAGSAVKELAAAIQPLLVADLPIHIWWRGVFLNQRQVVEQMLAFADRFIYDGVSWTNIHFTALQVADFIGKYEEKVGFTNFNWSRLRPWRESAADFFDTGLFENEINDLSNVRIEYTSLPGFEEGYQYRSLLFASWMAVQLEWEPVRGSGGLELSQLEFTDKKGNSVSVEMVLQPQSTSSSQSIQRIVMETKRGDSYNAFTVERDHKDKLMILRHEDKQRQRVLRKVPHADSSVADLLFRELGRRVRNRVFEKSFKMAANLLQMI